MHSAGTKVSACTTHSLRPHQLLWFAFFPPQISKYTFTEILAEKNSLLVGDTLVHFAVFSDKHADKYRWRDAQFPYQ